MLGKGYVIEHCVSFFRKKQEQQLFKNYVTDAIRIITYNTSRKGSGAMEQRYCDILNSLWKKQEDRTPQEIIDSISNKLSKMGRG